MRSENYTNHYYNRNESLNIQSYTDQYEETGGDITSFEEQLLLNYSDYLDDQYDLSDEYLEDDFDAEYDENDWEEED
ncbi:hypothetical protein [Flavobacterium gelatinilyticum]|uniref:hypothetical protein n=1 Tax=Flavobacterium gelatinilyticum TaxID=3003260 RepID=UPI00248083C9|nr:hypothetical protein [Flavobacterium gelatinilyticum]